LNTLQPFTPPPIILEGFIWGEASQLSRDLL
jgi:hypothetical protein